ncbi:MAG: hypothetical protein RR645_07435, partial [Clostridium sp.]
FEVSLLNEFSEEISALEQESCICVEPNGDVALTPKGFKYSSIIGRLFYSESALTLESAYIPK